MSPSTRRGRRARPELESLEGRQLLSAQAAAAPDASASSATTDPVLKADRTTAPLQDRRLSYTTPDGARVRVVLYGPGTLAGSHVNPDGSLDLVYDKTFVGTRIIGHVKGGNGTVPLRSLRDASLPVGSDLSTGVNPVGRVNLRQFDLVDGGYINLSGGISNLFLDAVGRSTHILLKQSPVLTKSTSGSNVQIINGQPVVGGIIQGGTAAITTSGNTTTTAGGPVTGVRFYVNRIDAGPKPGPGVGHPNLFGYDPTANALIRFDGATGAPVLTIPLASAPMARPAVGLGRNAGRLAVLAGSGDLVVAYDALDGRPLGHFTTANLAAEGLTSVDGLALVDTRTVIVSAAPGGGLAQAIDLTASLATGQAVPLGTPVRPGGQLVQFIGGATGIPGSATLYASGAALINNFNPALAQYGIFATPTAAGILNSTTQSTLVGPGLVVNSSPPGAVLKSTIQALGAYNNNLALDYGVSNGTNFVEILNPTNLAPLATIHLDDPNQLTGLSESFYPEFADSAVIQVNGALRIFSAKQADGLVMAVNGILRILSIRQATDTYVQGLPILHASVPVRQNVQLVSTRRPDQQGTKGGVTIVPTLSDFGGVIVP